MKNFIEKHPFWFSVAFTVLVMQILGIVTVVICRALGFSVVAYKVASAGVTTIVPLIFIWRIGWWKDSGLVSKTENAYALTVPLILMFFPLVFYGTIQLNAQTSTLYLLAVLFTGISEEAVYRGLFGRAFLPYGKWKAVLIPSIIFASAHIVQSLGGEMSLQENLAQIANAFISGLLLGAVRLRVNNIWPLIFIHAIRDLFWLTGGLWDGVLSLSTYQTTVAPLFVWLPSIIAAIYLMRKPIAATINGVPVGTMDKPLTTSRATSQPAN